MIKTFEQKATALEQKLELAKELGLKDQVSLIHKEIKINELEQKNTYLEVTRAEARGAMCPKKEIKFEQKMIGKWWRKDWAECQWGRNAWSFMSKDCGRTDTHIHIAQPGLHAEIPGRPMTELAEPTPLPMAALIRMKEAKEKNIFDHFEVWRPETDSEEKTRLEDPWLVGAVGSRYFKLCDWR